MFGCSTSGPLNVMIYEAASMERYMAVLRAPCSPQSDIMNTLMHFLSVNVTDPCVHAHLITATSISVCCNPNPNP